MFKFWAFQKANRKESKYIKATMAENSLNQGKEMNIQINMVQKIPNIWNLNQATSRHTKCSNSKNPKNSKRRERCYIQGNTHKSISGFLNRNFAGQETMR